MKYLWLAPIASWILGGVIFVVGLGVSHLSDPVGELISIIGGMCLSPIVYGCWVFRKTHALQLAVPSAIIGFLGIYAPVYLLKFGYGP